MPHLSTANSLLLLLLLLPLLQQAEADARKRRAQRADAAAAFRTLLSESVREAGAEFELWLPKLKRDPLVSAHLRAICHNVCVCVRV
jgi:hypothetical protein